MEHPLAIAQKTAPAQLERTYLPAVFEHLVAAWEREADWAETLPTGLGETLPADGQPPAPASSP